MRYLGLLWALAGCEDLHVVTVPNELAEPPDAGRRQDASGEPLPDLLPYADLRPAPPDLAPLCAGDDSEEPNQACPGSELGELRENQRQDFVARLFPAGDSDVFHLKLRQVDGVCQAGTAQRFCAQVKLFGAPGQELAAAACGGIMATGTVTATQLCFGWSGTCGVPDDRDLMLQVSGAADCGDYDLQILYYSEGTFCPC